MKKFLFLMLTGCGADTSLQKIIACAADLDCPAGQVCAADHSQCVAVDGADLANWPPPKTSGQLLERFGRMAFTASGEPGSETVAFGGSAGTPVTAPLQTAACNARVSGSTLELWATQFVGGGGSLTVWPISRDGTYSVPVQSIAVAFDAIRVPLVEAAYPNASASSEVTAIITANIGDEGNAAAITATLPATLDVRFGVVDGVLAARVHLEAHATAGAGAAGWLHAYDLVLDATLVGNAVPSRWLP